MNIVRWLNSEYTVLKVIIPWLAGQGNDILAESYSVFQIVFVWCFLDTHGAKMAVSSAGAVAVIVNKVDIAIGAGQDFTIFDNEGFIWT